MRRVLVTGASGFVGRVLCETLSRAGYCVRAAVRQYPAPVGAAEALAIGDIARFSEWATALHDVDFVIHAAARVHVLNDVASNEDLYHATNVEATQKLVTAASQSSVRRFVFLSSVKVNGEETSARAFASDDTPHPQDDYGKSKWLAEQVVLESMGRAEWQSVVVRSPMVYGPQVRANFLRLLRWVEKGWPLPLASVRNRRSLVSVWNLCDLLTNVLENPAAGGRIWMVSDGHDVSTPELISRIGLAMNRPSRLLPVPIPLLRLLGAALGRSAEIGRLCDSLAVDIRKTRQDLGWSPVVTLDEALSRTVAWYLAESRAGR